MCLCACLCALQGMLGAAQLLMLSKMDSQQQALLGIISNSIDQLRDVLTNVTTRPAKCARCHGDWRLSTSGAGAGEAEQGRRRARAAAVRSAGHAAPSGE